MKNNTEKTGIKDFILKTARYKAVNILSRYERSDSYADKLLAHEMNNNDLEPRDKALLNELVNGVIRWRGKLDWILTGFYHGDYQKCLNIVKNSMRVGLYQIVFLNKIPEYSAINEAVEIVKRIQGEKTAGIVNGVLRNIARNLENVRYPLRTDDKIYHLSIMNSHPKWMIKRWFESLGEEETEKLLEFNNIRPAVPVRVNLNLAKVEEIEKIFKDHDVEYYKSEYHPSTLMLVSPRYDISASDLFKTGKITIQDPAASLAASLAQPKEGDFVLDMCAAPGGKSVYIAEMMKDAGRIVSVDKYKSKIRLINEYAERMNLNSIEAMIGDSRELDGDLRPDIIIVDAPCSGLGTLAKKPEIKWKRDIDDIPKLVNTQRELLESAYKLMKPGSALVYSSCTIEPEENEENIRWFIEKYPDIELDPCENYLPNELCIGGYLMIYPQRHKMDGTFAARMIKKSE